MDEYKYGMNSEEASEAQKASEAELQAELDNGDTDIFEPKAPIRGLNPEGKEQNDDVTSLEDEIKNL